MNYDATSTELADLFATNPRTIREYPHHLSRKEGRSRIFDLRKVVKWREQQAYERGAKEGGIDARKRGEDGEALSIKEELDTVKIELLELKLQREKSEVIDKAEVEMIFNELAAALRDAGLALQRRYGTEAQDYIDNAVDAFMARVEIKDADCESEKTES